MGRLIVFEGPDKVGKTTVINNIKDEVDSNIVFTKEPGCEKPICQAIRNLLLNNDYDPHKLTELFLFIADRMEHQHKIVLPELEKNDVISDRYWQSTYIYQVISREIISIDQYISLHNLLNLKEPDVYVYFDTDGSLNDKDNNRMDDEFDSNNTKITSAYDKLYSIYNEEKNIKTYKYTITKDTIDVIHNVIIKDLGL